MPTWQGYERKSISEERLVRAVNVLAEIMEQHGSAYAPLYDSLQHELAEFRHRQRIFESSTEPLLRELPRKVA